MQLEETRISANSLSTLPLISIIMVTYNAGNHLEAALQSIKTLILPNSELLIFDGGSTDNTLEILNKYNDTINYWQSEPDNGIYHAMNKALKKASGKWIYFLGSDDTLLKGFASMLAQLKKDNCVYYGDYTSDGKTYGGSFTTYRLAKSNLCQQAVFYPRLVFEKYTFNEKYPISADHVLNMQCWADKNFYFEYHPITVAHFSPQGISSRNTDKALEADKDALIKKYLGLKAYRRYRFRKIKDTLKKMLNPFKK